MIPDCTNVWLHAVSLPASIVHPSVCLYPDDLHSCLPIPSVCLSVQLPIPPMCLYICLLSQYVHLYFKKACSFVCLPTQRRGDTRAGQGHQAGFIHGPEPAGAAASFGWQRVPTVGTLWHRWARGKYRGERRWLYSSYWGVTDNAGPPRQQRKRNALNVTQSHLSNILMMWRTFLFVAKYWTNITEYRYNHVFLQHSGWLWVHSISYELWPSDIPSFKAKELPSVTSSMFCLNLMQQIHLILLKSKAQNKQMMEDNMQETTIIFRLELSTGSGA